MEIKIYSFQNAIFSFGHNFKKIRKSVSLGALLCPEVKAVLRHSLRRGQVLQFLPSALLCPPKLAAAPSTDQDRIFSMNSFSSTLIGAV